MNLSRRQFGASMASAAAGIAAASSVPDFAASADSATPSTPAAPTLPAPALDDPNWKITRGRIKQSVVSWCFNPMTTDTLARGAAAMGLKSVELVGTEHWPTLKKYGLVCALSGSHGFVDGWNHAENHPMCVEKVTQAINATADAFPEGTDGVITFSGMRKGISDDDGMKNCVDGVKKVIGLAEKRKVNLCIEVLNSRVNVSMHGHPDYQADKLEWAVAWCDKVGSPRLKILFDIYHIQIMEGDVITRIRQYKDYIGHYHTAGVPGRNELDDQQEINYPPIIRAILDTGYAGFLAQEYIPRTAKTDEEKLASLRQGVRICDV